MKKKVIDLVISFIGQYKNYSKEELEKLRYGIEGIYLTITKFIIILLTALLLGILKEILLLLVFFNIIRYTGFGFHAERSYQCLILSMIYFICIPLLFININLSNFVIYIICTMCIISYLLFAPADTVKRPLPNKKKRIIRKWSTVLIGIVYSCIIIIFPNSQVSPLLLSALVVQAVVINPLLYQLFKQPYNNYKNYTKILNTYSI